VWSAASGQGAGDTRSATLYRSLQWLQKTATSPVLITIDDLQWADPDSWQAWVSCAGGWRPFPS
jgi:hypothetical protein